MSVVGKFKFLQSQLQGVKTSRRIVVIESDDWGSERIPSTQVRNELEKAGIDVNSNPHSKYDTLERLEDLIVLEELLTNLEKEYNKKVRITTNFITSNPNFAKIKDSDFQKYSFEPFIETYKRRDGDDRVLKKLLSLIKSGYLRPQFHGREHINALLWLEELKGKNPNFLKAFDLGCYAIDAPTKEGHRRNLMAAFEYENEMQKDFILRSVEEGMRQFEEVFGFRSTTLIAPRYVWNSDLEFEFNAMGIKYMQTTFYQQEPMAGGYKNKYHFSGQLNKVTGMRYLVRNLFFEPSYNKKVDWVNKSFEKVQVAFRLNIPAVISMHRINFVGGLDINMRDNNLNQFEQLLIRIIKAYPEVEFLSSDELASTMQKKTL